MPPRSTRSRATGRVTLADVASLAGVSPITVSRALRGERAVDAELVSRVRAAADRLGYVPDPAARALASRHSTHVALLIPMLSNALFVDLLEGVQRGLRAAGYQTLIGVTHYDAGEEEQGAWRGGARVRAVSATASRRISATCGLSLTQPLGMFALNESFSAVR